MTFTKEDYTWITNLGDNTLYQNENKFALIANENIVVKRIRVAKFNDDQVRDIMNLVDRFDNAEYSDEANSIAENIEDMIKDGEIEQYIDGKQVK